MPPKGKATKNAPNQHDKRHENGLIAPGKRVARQRSNGQLNGVPNGKSAPAVPPPALPSKGLNTNPGFRFPKPADGPGPSSTATARNHAAALDVVARDRTASDASLDDVGPCNEMVDGYEHASPELHAAAAGKNNPTHAGSTFSTVSTILAYYPLRDAISILILLLSLPPTLGLIIQTLFASLTFVPPSAGLSTLPNVKEMFNSSNFGYPALATILFVDVFFWGCWLPLWKPAQAIFLDLSQAVIAVSLSGAAASSGGPTYSIATCTLIVCVVHVLRYRAIHLTALDYLRSVLHKMDISTPFDVPSFASSYHSSPPLDRGMVFNALRTILGIHIVSQGVTTCVRRTLANAKANEKDNNLPSIIKTDPEASAGSEPLSRANSGLPDGSHSPFLSSNTDGRLSGQPLANRESRPRESNSKKKRKQANQVRSQQPLWAAIASTKVTFVKEMEQRDAADDAREATAMDNNQTSPFLTSTDGAIDRVWVCEVRDTSIYFAVEISPEAAAENLDQAEDCVSVNAGIDKTKPFFIRINGAAWSSARIVLHDGSGAGDCYWGEVFGLAPLSSYHCEIVSIAKQKVLCSVSLITQPAPSAEQAAAAPAPPPHQTLRPSSPITTLKQSIQSAEAKLNETRNRTRKTKKDQRAAHADIKKEINMLKSKLESSGGVDDKQERRLVQISQHKNQAEEATAELKAQIDAVGEIPSAELADSQAKKRTWQSALDAKKAASREMENSKAEHDRELNALKTEISASELRKEKLAARSVQREQELEKLTAKHQADMTAKQKRDFDRAQDTHLQEARIHEFNTQIHAMEHEAQSWNQKGQEAYQAASALSGWSMQGAPGFPGYSSPPTPEGMHPTANGQTSPPANGFPSGPFGPQAYTSAFSSSQPAIHHMHSTSGGAPRGRSSSMLSQISGFTDNGDDFEFLPNGHHHQSSWPAHGQSTVGASYMDRKASDGDGSGSVSGSGDASLVNGSTNGSNSPRPEPRPEAKPFVPGAVKSVGTIGPPGRKTPQSPTAVHAGANGR